MTARSIRLFDLRGTGQKARRAQARPARLQQRHRISACDQRTVALIKARPNPPTIQLGMSALVADRRTAKQAAPTRSIVHRVQRTLVVLYWTAGALLIIPIALCVWAIGVTIETVFSWRTKTPRTPHRPPTQKGDPP